jgi:hypothetical protein
MGSVVVEGIVVDIGIAMVAVTTEDVGAETVVPVTLGITSLITGEIMDSEALVAVDAFEPLLGLFPLGFSMFCLGLILGGGLTISGSDFPFLRSIHYAQNFLETKSHKERNKNTKI